MKKGDKVRHKERPALIGTVDKVHALGKPKPIVVRLYWDKLPNRACWFRQSKLKVTTTRGDNPWDDPSLWVEEIY